jgi:phosphatidate phosphatase APP1
MANLVNYESQQNTYKVLFQLENAEIQIITDIEKTLKNHSISEATIKLTQSLA